MEQINVLFTLAIEKQYAPLQEETLTLLNTLAELLQEDFAQYYNTFMPGMKQMLSIPCTTAEQQNLRTNLITTIGCIIESVKDKPECHGDAHQIAAVLVGILSTAQIEEFEEQEVAIKGTLVQLAACLKHEFKQYLGPLIQVLIADMKRDLDFRVVDAAMAELEEQDGDSKL